jgi:hypothetical protein
LEKRVVAKNVLLRNESNKDILKAVKTRVFKNLSLKMFTEFKNSSTFAVTVLATLRFAKTAYQGESFAFTGYRNLTNTPSMPLYNAHLGGLFFYKPSSNDDLR